jgi:hypothetical protein
MTERDGLPEQPSGTAPGIAVDARFLLDLADEVWRLERRTERLARAIGAEPLKGIADSAVRLKEILANEQVTFEDHTGERFQEHLSMRVVQVLEHGDEEGPLWIEDTLKPMVRMRGLAVRPSHVILAAKPAPAEEVRGE